MNCNCDNDDNDDDDRGGDVTITTMRALLTMESDDNILTMEKLQ